MCSCRSSAEAPATKVERTQYVNEPCSTKGRGKTYAPCLMLRILTKIERNASLPASFVCPRLPSIPPGSSLIALILPSIPFPIIVRYAHLQSRSRSSVRYRRVTSSVPSVAGRQWIWEAEQQGFECGALLFSGKLAKAGQYETYVCMCVCRAMRQEVHGAMRQCLDNPRRIWPAKGSNISFGHFSWRQTETTTVYRRM